MSRHRRTRMAKSLELCIDEVILFDVSRVVSEDFESAIRETLARRLEARGSIGPLPDTLSTAVANRVCDHVIPAIASGQEKSA